ncbi:hypothetical protein JGUZn3_03270 [Entomobacter blattae]|uniref:Uncharacterized protein n=1 Tax=Entomobacter blattae TaxID=2762277 RepID=A0A7H1NP74_9PROT|nr:hypothetical protein JGUZn3_03270 [Entomobacter blattae]
MFIFKGKPDEQTRTLLKKNAFKWSPSKGAWIRQITGNAQSAARRIIKELKVL